MNNRAKRSFHVWIMNSSSDQFGLVREYESIHRHTRPAVWKSRSTAFLWGRKLTEDRTPSRFLVLQCKEEHCPLCGREEKP